MSSKYVDKEFDDIDEEIDSSEKLYQVGIKGTTRWYRNERLLKSGDFRCNDVGTTLIIQSGNCKGAGIVKILVLDFA